MNDLCGRIESCLARKVHVNGIEIGFTSIIIESCLLRDTKDQVRVQEYANMRL